MIRRLLCWMGWHDMIHQCDLWGCSMDCRYCDYWTEGH